MSSRTASSLSTSTDDPRLLAWFDALLATPGLTALRDDRAVASAAGDPTVLAPAGSLDPAGTALLTLSVLSPLWIAATVDESDIGKVKAKVSAAA